MTQYTSKPETPIPGDSYIDINARTVSVFDGNEWQVFTEYELLEMEMIQLLMTTGRTQEQAEQAIHMLQHGHIHIGDKE
jgi:hypothetical protein